LKSSLRAAARKASTTWRWRTSSTLGTVAAPRTRRRARLASGGRITGDGVDRTIKAALARYYRSTGADDPTARPLAARYSGHSGRVGFVVAAKEGGAGDSDIASTTRHKSLQMIKRYGEAAEQRRRAPHRLPGVGL